MKNLIFVLLVFLASCAAKTKIYQCNPVLTDYSDFDYEILDKNFIGSIGSDSLYSADLLLKAYPKDSIILMDSIYCYCLAVCKAEKLTDARFYNNLEGFEISKKYKIKSFNHQVFSSTVTNNHDLQLIYKYAIASIKIEPLNERWREYLNSDNLSVLGFQQIAPLEGKYIKRKLVVK